MVSQANALHELFQCLARLMEKPSTTRSDASYTYMEMPSTGRGRHRNNSWKAFNRNNNKIENNIFFRITQLLLFSCHMWHLSIVLYLNNPQK